MFLLIFWAFPRQKSLGQAFKARSLRGAQTNLSILNAHTCHVLGLKLILFTINYTSQVFVTPILF